MNKKLLRKKLALMLANLKKKRKYFCEVEYLESTGTQYIDTGVKPKANKTSVKLVFALTELATPPVGIFGSRVSTDPNSGQAYNLFSGTTEGTDRIRSDWSYNASEAPYRTSSGYVLSDVLTANSLIDVELNSNSSSKINSGVFSQSGVTKYDCNYSMFIGSINTGGTAFASKPKAKWYYCKIWDNGVLVRDFIPVLDWDMKPCMYDRVSGELFYNRGTGEFLYGRQVHPVEYLESTGTQYIDTGVYMHNSLSFSFRFSPIQVSDGYPSVYMGGAYAYGGIDTAQVSFVCSNGINGSGNRFMNFNVTPPAEIYLGDWYDYYADKNYIQIGNAKAYLGSNIASTTALKTIDIFAILYKGSYIFGKTKISFFKIYDNGVLVRDFIPAVDQTGKAFMFDRVTHTIFDNAGTGAFSYPPVELEYLESTGTQWIDTGYIPTNSTGYKLKHTICEDNNTDNLIIGCREDSGDTRFWEDIDWGPSDTLGWGYGTYSNNNLSYRWSLVGKAGNVVESGCNYYNSRTCFVNDEIKLLPQPELPEITRPMYLFCANFAGSSGYFIKSKIYYAKITEGSELVRDFIPVFYNGQLGMWDKVNKVFYPNLGTNNFVCGPVKEDEYE